MIDKAKFTQEIKNKYSFKDETFLRVAKDNPKDKIEVEVGDSKQPDFKPQVKVQRWDNEVNLSFRLKDDGVEPETVDTKTDKIVWKKGKREAHFYDIQNAEHPDGAYEFEVVLLKKPTTNVVEFSLNTKGLDFFYQPALNDEFPIGSSDEGRVVASATETETRDSEGKVISSRSENIVRSYAVYASQQKTNWVGGKEYKCGKVGHIFRPQVEDANGVKVWGELNVDTVNGILSVTIPQDFLDNSVYPVRHAAGLTFGYTTAGGTKVTVSTATNPIGQLHSSYTASSGDIITGMTASVSNAAGASGTANFGIYTQVSGLPVTLTGGKQLLTVPTSTQSWRSVSGLSISLTGGTIYNSALGGAVTNSFVFYRDTGSGNERSLHNSTGDLPSTWTSSGTTASLYSIYATYTAGGSASSSVSSSVSSSPSSSVSPSISPSQSPSASISPSASLSPSKSPSQSPSASLSPSISPSPSPSQSPSASLSPSVSPSPSPSQSPSASLSPSLSPSSSPSQSPSASFSPSISPSPSPSQSPSASLSPSQSPSASISPSQSPSASISPSQSPSASLSPSQSPSASLSPSASPSASPSQSPSASLSPSKSPSISPSQSPSASLSPSPSPSASPSQSPSASKSPSLSPSASPSQSPSASLSPSQSPSFSPSQSPSASLSPSQSPSISPSQSPSASISPSISPSPSPSQSPSASISPSASPSASPSQSPSASLSPSQSPSLSPSQSPSASISPSQSPSASLSPSASPSISPSAPPYGAVLRRWNGSQWIKAKLKTYASGLVYKPLFVWENEWVEVDIYG